jgi:hypothetical protein
MLSSAPCEYRHNAMLNFREKEATYNELYNLTKVEIGKTQQLEYSDKETMHKYRFSVAEEQKRWLDEQMNYNPCFDTKERKIHSMMRKIQKEKENGEIRKEALLRLKNKVSKIRPRL